jgi:polysaccharide export outer membrane protein
LRLGEATPPTGRTQTLEGRLNTLALRALVLAGVMGVAGCGSNPSPPPIDAANVNGTEFLIGAGESLNIFVWRNPELSTGVTVRPDGKFSMPLVEDVDALGKTPTQLARDLEDKLKKFVRDPIVTVMTPGSVGIFDQQVRIVGEAVSPRAIPYREGMSLLDVMIQVGGLTKFASGNRAVVVRKVNGDEQSYPVKIDNLIRYGDIRYNYPMQPGDILIIPQSVF